MQTTLADKWFSLFIRLRDTWDDGYCRCITCGRVGDPKSMDCGHYVKRQHQAGRFDERNCHAQCKRCNAFEQGMDSVYRQKLVEMYGEQVVLLLESGKYNTLKRTKVQMQVLVQQYKYKATELSKLKNIKLW